LTTQRFNESWFDTKWCKRERECRTCRSREDGRSWRENVDRQYDVPDVDFECPYGKPWRSEAKTPEGMGGPLPPGVMVDPYSPHKLYEKAIAAVAALDQTDPTVIRINEKLDIAKRDIEANKHCYPCVEKVYKRFVKTSAAMIRLVAPKD